MVIIKITPSVLRGKNAIQNVRYRLHNIDEVKWKWGRCISEHIIEVNHFLQKIINTGYPIQENEKVSVLIETIPLWYFHTLSGIWGEEGVDIYDELVLTFFVEEFMSSPESSLTLMETLPVPQEIYCHRENNKRSDVFITILLLKMLFHLIYIVIFILCLNIWMQSVQGKNAKIAISNYMNIWDN